MSYQSEVLADSPSMYWRLGEPSGTNANDETANNRDGTYSGAVTLGTTGALTRDADTAITLDGSTGKVTSSYDPFTNGTQRSFEAWSYRDATTDFDVFFGTGGDNGAFRGGSGSTDAIFEPKFGFATATWTGVVPTAGWFHWVLTFDESADVAELYINGVSQTTKALATQWAAGSIILGANSTNSTGNWAGRMDEFAVYESILSATRVGVHYDVGFNGPAPGPRPTFNAIPFMGGH